MSKPSVERCVCTVHVSLSIFNAGIEDVNRVVMLRKGGEDLGKIGQLERKGKTDLKIQLNGGECVGE